MQNFLQDIRYGTRVLAKNPGFALIAILTLALGIGANTAIFSVVNAELLRPLPFHDPGRLVHVWMTNSQTNVKSFPCSYPDFTDWRAQNQVFEGMASYRETTNTLTGVPEPAHLDSAIVSAGTFELLGAGPQLGRTFLPEEDEPHHHAAILSDRLWRQDFGSDLGIIGRTIMLDGNAYTVVGVMPASFRFPIQREPVALWISLSATRESTDEAPAITQQRGAHFLQVIARLKTGVSLAQAQAAMDVIASSLQKQYPDTNSYAGIRLVSEQEEITGVIRPALFVLLVAVGLVLLIACVNVANLLLARAATRAREIAIRAALGAGRARVMRQLLTESLLLALAAGVLGVAFASWGCDALVRLSPANLPRVAEVRIDGWVLGFTLFLSVLTGFLFGLAPALQVTRSNITDTLKEGGLSSTAGMHRHWLRSSLVIVEMALALVLLVSAGLLIRSLARLHDVSPGFDARNVMTSTLDLPDDQFSDPKKDQLIRELMPRLKAIPGVETAGAIEPLPMSGMELRTAVEIEGRPVARQDERLSSVRIITPEYFAAMHIPLLQGREFTERDAANTTPVVIVNQALAEQFFPGENPIGKRIRPGISNGAGPGEMREIVGVVGNVKYRDLRTEWTPESYIPFTQLPIEKMTIVARAANDPNGLARPIAEAIRSLVKDLPAYDQRPLQSYLNATVAIPRFNTVLLGIFAGVALVLTSIGLYGVVSYSVAQRTHEIGIRMALGAVPRDMMRLVVGEGLRLGLLGVGLGLAAAFAFTRFLASLLFGVTSSDPVSFAGVVLLLLAVVFLACYVPARRAMRVDPMVALRYE